jgi:magnesium chelatase family protein
MGIKQLFSMDDLPDTPHWHEVRARATEAIQAGKDLLLVGLPGSPRAMLARRLVGALPDLPDGERSEVYTIHHRARLLPDDSIPSRPFRAPHYSASDAAMAGGSREVQAAGPPDRRGNRPRARKVFAGEVSLAHRGILFLDDMQEFRRAALEAVGWAHETGTANIALSLGSTEKLPAKFQVVAAMNPCPCGGAGPIGCRCSAEAKARYWSRVPSWLNRAVRIDLTGESL